MFTWKTENKNGVISGQMDFGTVDGKGRKIGMCAAIYEDGQDLYVRTNATRDGECFGALVKPVKVAGSIEDAKLVAAKRAAAAQKRYAKG